MNYSSIADLYDICVQATFDIPFFLKEAIQSDGEVLELMSGTGRVSLPLIEAGVHLTCVDLSPAMLSALRNKLARKGLAAPVYAMNVCQLDLGRQFDLVLIPFHSFAEITAAADRQSALGRIYQHLKPGGRFICTLHNPAIRAASVDGQLKLWGQSPIPDGKGTLLFWGYQVLELDGKTVSGVEFFEEYDPQGLLLARRFIPLRFVLLGQDEFQAQAAEAGFQVRALYGDYDWSTFQPAASPYMLWVLEKPCQPGG
jgi:SAM-dependent methyltransferase